MCFAKVSISIIMCFCSKTWISESHGKTVFDSMRKLRVYRYAKRKADYKAIATKGL